MGKVCEKGITNTILGGMIMGMSLRVTSGIAAAALGIVALSGTAQAAEEIKITAASGLPPFSDGTKQVIEFLIPEIDKRLAAKGNYEIKWTLGWGGSIAGQFDLFEGIEDGIADLGYVNTLFEGAKLPLEQFTYVTPFGSEDLKKVIAISDQLREAVPEMDEQFAKHNQQRLGIFGIKTYHFETTFPIKTLDDIKGRKFGAPGLAANWIADTGAVAVAGSLSQYYNSLQTGVYDGIIIFESGIGPFKFFEVAPHVTKVGIGSMLASNLTFNQDKWESLPEEVRNVFAEVGKEWVDVAAEGAITGSKRSLDTAIAGGAIVTEMSGADIKTLAATIPNIAQQWAKAADEKGLPGTRTLNTYMELSRKAGIEHARAWDKE
jgi:TRAP-type C4-dicarboxylate transport system substrate-binding protein